MTTEDSRADALTDALRHFAESVANDPDEHPETRARASEALAASRVDQPAAAPWRGACPHTTANTACRICCEKHGADYDQRTAPSSADEQTLINEIFERQEAGFERCFEALGIADDRERSWSSLVMAINDALNGSAEEDDNEPTEEMVRYCPECGHIGEVSESFHDCCPEGSSARVVPKQFAETCQKTFKDLVNRPNLKVWVGEMPESNGKTNYTAILHKGDISEGITLEMCEYPDRTRYEADRMKWMLGLRADEPCLLDYDPDKHSGYKPPEPKPPYDAINRVDAFVRRYRTRRGLDQNCIHALDGDLELRPDDLQAIIHCALNINPKAMLGVTKAYEQWQQSPFFYEWTTNEQHAELNFRAGWLLAKTDGGE